MGNNLEFHKMTFCGLFIYCFIRMWKEILGQIVLSDPQGLESNPYFVEYGFCTVNNCVTPQVTKAYESLKEHQKNKLHTEIWKCVGRIVLEGHFLSFGFFPLASPSQFSDTCKYMFVNLVTASLRNYNWDHRWPVLEGTACLCQSKAHFRKSIQFTSSKINMFVLIYLFARCRNYK